MWSEKAVSDLLLLVSFFSLFARIIKVQFHISGVIAVGQSGWQKSGREKIKFLTDIVCHTMRAIVHFFIFQGPHSCCLLTWTSSFSLSKTELYECGDAHSWLWPLYTFSSKQQKTASWQPISNSQLIYAIVNISMTSTLEKKKTPPKQPKPNAFFSQLHLFLNNRCSKFCTST